MIENTHIEWHEGHTPAQEGTYFVTGIGINNIEKMQFTDGKWSDPSKIPFGYGELDSPTYSMVYTSAHKVTGVTAAQAKRAHIEGLGQIISMMGTRKSDGTDVPIVHLSIYKDGHTECSWTSLADLADETIMAEFDRLCATLDSKLTKSAHRKKEEPTQAEPEAVTDEPAPKVMKDEPVQQETLFDESPNPAEDEGAGEDAVPASDDDLPF